MLSWIFIVLVHWNNSPRVDMLLHSDTLFWFRAIQSLLFLLNTNLLLFGLTQPELDPTIYRTRGEHANHNATDVVSKLIKTVLFSNFFFSLQLTTRRKCIVAMYQQINERLLKTNYVTNNTMDNSWIHGVYSAIFQLYHGENKFIFNEMMMRSALY